MSATPATSPRGIPVPVSGAAPQPGASRHTTGSLAASLSAELVGPSNLPITGLAAIDSASQGELTFIRSGRYASRWAASGASAALVTRGVSVARHDPSARALLIVDNADLALVTLLKLFMPRTARPQPGIHPSAVVHPSATIGHGVHIGPHCAIGEGTTVGDGAVLLSHIFLGDEVSVGFMTTLHPGVRILDRCVVGSACELWPNVVIGADGFGYVPAPGGRGLIKIPHIGNVVVGDHVDIGAATCIDRAKFGSTTIGDGTKIDNHCQIAHNVMVGRSVIICGMAGIAGSVTIGDGVIIAGHVGVSDNVTIGARAVIAAKAGVITDVPAGEAWFGTPAGPHKDQMRSFAALRKLPDIVRRFIRVEHAVHRAGLAGKRPEAPRAPGP